MKIFMIHFSTITNVSGGMEKVLCEFSSEMARRGHEVHILIYDIGSGKPYYPVHPAVKIWNLRSMQGEPLKMPLRKKIVREFVRLKGTQAMSAWYDRYRAPYILPTFQKLYDQIQPDIMVVYYYSSSWLVSRIHRNCPVIQMCHNDPRRRFAKMSREQMEAVGSFDLIQALTPRFQDMLHARFPGTPVTCIPNVVPQLHQQADLGASKDRFTIICVGRLIPGQKRQDLLISAFGKLADAFPEWNVEIWGGGKSDYAKQLEKQIADGHLQGRVFLKGTTTDIFSQYRKADLFVFPSAYEGWGLAMTEAMSMGLPAVAFRSCSGVNEIIKDGKTGILVQDGVDALSEGMRRLMSDRTLRMQMGVAAKSDMAQYAPEKIWTRWETVLRRYSEKE